MKRKHERGIKLVNSKTTLQPMCSVSMLSSQMLPRTPEILKHRENSRAIRCISTEFRHISRQSDWRKNSLTSRIGCQVYFDFQIFNNYGPILNLLLPLRFGWSCSYYSSLCVVRLWWKYVHYHSTPKMDMNSID